MRTFRLKKCKRAVGLSFTPDGKQVAVITSAAEDHVGSVVWVDVASGEPQRTLELDVNFCALSRDQQYIAIAYAPEVRPRGVKSVRWAKLTSEDTDWIDVPDVPYSQILTLQFNNGGDRLAVGCFGKRGRATEWQHATHIVPLGRGKSLTIEDDLLVGTIAFSHDEAWLAVAGGPGGDREIRLHRLPKTTPERVHTPKSTRTQRLLFAPDRPVFAALAGKQVLLFDVNKSEPIALLDGHTAQVNGAVFTADGSKLISVAHDGSVRVWDAHAGTLRNSFAWSIGKTTAIALAPDGLTAIAAGEKGQFVVWDLDE